MDLWSRYYWAGLADDPNLYRPVTMLSYYLNARVPGAGAGAADRRADGGVSNLNPGWFRVVNIGLLAGVGVLVAGWLSPYVGARLVWLAGAVVVAHPAHAEMVNHVVGRADLLAIAGVLVVLLAQRRAMAAGGWSWGTGLAGLAGAVVAIGSKESGLVVVPLVVLLGYRVDVVRGGVAGEGRRRGERLNQGATPGRLPGVPGMLPGAVPGARETTATSPRENFRGAGVILPGVVIPGVVIPGVVAVWLIGRAVAVGWGVDYTPGTDALNVNPLRDAGWVERVPAGLAVAGHYARQLVWAEHDVPLQPVAGAGLVAPGDDRRVGGAGSRGDRSGSGCAGQALGMHPAGAGAGTLPDRGEPRYADRGVRGESPDDPVYRGRGDGRGGRGGVDDASGLG